MDCDKSRFKNTSFMVGRKSSAWRTVPHQIKQKKKKKKIRIIS